MGISFDDASVGVTYSKNTGKYTKIGNQVTVTGFLVLSDKGTSTKVKKITGLPFTIFNNDANHSAPALRLRNISFANQFQGYGSKNSTTIRLEEVTEAGTRTSLTDANFANNSDIIVSLTYFVN
jgi:hypothetical protein